MVSGIELLTGLRGCFLKDVFWNINLFKTMFVVFYMDKYVLGDYLRRVSEAGREWRKLRDSFGEPISRLSIGVNSEGSVGALQKLGEERFGRLAVALADFPSEWVETTLGAFYPVNPQGSVYVPCCGVFTRDGRSLFEWGVDCSSRWGSLLGLMGQVKDRLDEDKIELSLNDFLIGREDAGRSFAVRDNALRIPYSGTEIDIDLNSPRVNYHS